MFKILNYKVVMLPWCLARHLTREMCWMFKRHVLHLVAWVRVWHLLSFKILSQFYVITKVPFIFLKIHKVWKFTNSEFHDRIRCIDAKYHFCEKSDTWRKNKSWKSSYRWQCTDILTKPTNAAQIPKMYGVDRLRFTWKMISKW